MCAGGWRSIPRLSNLKYYYVVKMNPAILLYILTLRGIFLTTTVNKTLAVISNFLTKLSFLSQLMPSKLEQKFEPKQSCQSQ